MRARLLVLICWRWAARAQVNFCLEWADARLRAVKPLRRRKPAALCVMQAAATNSAELLSPASKHLQQLAEHELVDMGMVAKELKAQQRGARGPASKKRMETHAVLAIYR